MLIYFLSAIASLMLIFIFYFALWLVSQAVAQFRQDKLNGKVGKK